MVPGGPASRILPVIVMPKKLAAQPELSGIQLAPQNVGYRIDAETRQLLGERCARLGVSPHEWARHCLLTLLHEDADRSGWQTAVASLHHEINDLRNDLALATQALLIVAGKMPEEKAREWIGRNLKPR